jgi:general secretion pathway protein C
MANAPGASHSLRRVLDQGEVARSMADLPKLLSEARVGPFYANGKVEGWKVERITPQSFYDRIGLQAGDVLQRVNGVEIRDPALILSLFQLLKNERSVSLDMLRDSRKTTMLFEIR